MISKNKITEIKKLAQKKFREELGLFIVEGTKSVIDLLSSQLIINELFATDEWIQKHQKSLNDVPYSAISFSELERISCLKTPQEVLAIVKIPSFDIQNIDFQKPILVLDGIRDPGNLGTIIRTADWFGIRQIVCSDDCVEMTNPKTIMATMGSFSRMDVYYTTLPDFLTSSHIHGTIYGTFMQGSPIQHIEFQLNDILVIGNEANGISEEVEALIQEKVHIPSYAISDTKAESLNASIATAIVLYQFCNKIFEK